MAWRDLFCYFFIKQEPWLLKTQKNASQNYICAKLTGIWKVCPGSGLNPINLLMNLQSVEQSNPCSKDVFHLLVSILHRTRTTPRYSLAIISKLNNSKPWGVLSFHAGTGITVCVGTGKKWLPRYRQLSRFCLRTEVELDGNQLAITVYNINL